MLKLSFLFIMPLLFGFRFNPMSQSLELTSSKSAQFTVENDTEEKMAIELTAVERKMNEQGLEELPKTNDISVFPPQMIIPAKEKRTVRVIWNGSEKIDSEKSYRIIAEQLPLKLDKKKRGTGIQMLMKYMAAFYVTPNDVEPKLEIKILESTQTDLKIKISNSGKKHQILFHPKISIKSKKQSWSFGEDKLPKIAGENILAQSERIFTILTKESIPLDSEIKIKVEE